MSNLHTPERGADEDFAAYKARRAASNAVAKTLLKGGEQRIPQRWTKGPDGKPKLTDGDPRGYWLGQHTNARRNKERTAMARVGRRQWIKTNKVARRTARLYPNGIAA